MTQAQIIGAGLMGLSTAYALTQRGVTDIRMIDEREHVGHGASYANAGMVHASLAAPWNGPGIAGQLLKSLLWPNPAMRLQLRAVPSLAQWGLKFLRASRPAPHWRATIANYELAAHSTALTKLWLQDLGGDTDYGSDGLLKIFRSQKELAQATLQSEKLAELGIKYQALTPAQACTKEPALTPIKDKLSGALYFPDDFKANAYQFCQALEKALRKSGAEFVMNTSVDGFTQNNDKVTGVRAGGKTYSAETTIIAAGAHSYQLMAKLGQRLPVRPVKGYSLTFENMAGPKLPVVDETLHAAITPLGGALRIAGTAEITGFNDSQSDKHLSPLLGMLQAIYPELAAGQTLSSGAPWHGFRPVSADGIPYIGRTKIPGLAINTGQAHMGWTLAAGSGDVLVDIILARDTAIETRQFCPRQH